MQSEAAKSKIVHDFIVEQFGVDYWDKYQRAIFLWDGEREALVKARQVGLSFAFAADALARALLFGEQFLITSYNREEAAQKIEYAKYFLSHIRMPLPAVTQDSMTALAFDNGGKILSVPARSVRGRSHNIYADEFDFYLNAADAYRAINPSVVRQDDRRRRLRVWSTIAQRNGLLHKIIMDERKVYRTQFIPWWKSHALCVDVERAEREAPLMDTHERVYTFGTKKLIQQFEDPIMTLDDFRMEFECSFEGAADDSYLTLELLQPVLNEEITLRRFSSDRISLHISEPLTIGMDVGRRSNATEIMIVTTPENQVVASISLRQVSFQAQLDLCRKLLSTLQVKRFSIDATGIGMQMAEQLRREYGSVIHPVEFTAKKKLQLAAGLKKLVETGRMEIPYDKRLVQELIAVKYKADTGVQGARFYVKDLGEQHNGDKFWALAMAVTDTAAEPVHAIAPNMHVGYTSARQMMRRRTPTLWWQRQTARDSSAASSSG